MVNSNQRYEILEVVVVKWYKLKKCESSRSGDCRVWGMFCGDLTYCLSLGWWLFHATARTRLLVSCPHSQSVLVDSFQLGQSSL